MLDVRETASLVGRSPETVRRWIWSGRLSARRHGNKLLVTRQAAEQLAHGPAAHDPLTLKDWAKTVEKLRRAGALGDDSAGTSAADLVLDDRASRQGV